MAKKKKLILYKRSPKAVTLKGEDGKLYVHGVEVTFQVDHHGRVVRELDSKDVIVFNNYDRHFRDPEVDYDTVD